MARGGRLPRTAGRPPRFLRTGHRRATSLSEAHLQAARRDAGHTLGREAEGVLQSLLFHRASRGLRAQRATFRVLAEGDPDVDAALASAVGCSPPPRSLTPPRPPLSDQRVRAARLPRLRRCPDCPIPAVRPPSARLLLWCLHHPGRLACAGRDEFGRRVLGSPCALFRANRGSGRGGGNAGAHCASGSGQDRVRVAARRVRSLGDASRPCKAELHGRECVSGRPERFLSGRCRGGGGGWGPRPGCRGRRRGRR